MQKSPSERHTRPAPSLPTFSGVEPDTEPCAGDAHMRQVIVDVCRLLDPKPDKANGTGRANGNGKAHADGNGAPQGGAGTGATIDLSPRMRQTLDRLLAGDNEKEIAARFGRSRHTVHVYVKQIYRRFGVSSRGELFARFIAALPYPAYRVDAANSPE